MSQPCSSGRPVAASISDTMYASLRPMNRSMISASVSVPAQPGEHDGVDPDGDPLGVHEDAVAVEDHEVEHSARLA